MMELFPEWSSLLPRSHLYRPPSSPSSSLQQEHIADNDDDSRVSCLHKFPDDVARDIARRLCLSMAPGSQSRVVQQDTTTTVNTTTTTPAPAYLASEDSISWSMQVIHYALSTPNLNEDYEVIKAALNVYGEWLSVALPHPRPYVPECIREQPNVYVRRIFRQLFMVFVPRQQNVHAANNIDKQTFLCHRALKLVEDVLHAQQQPETAGAVVLLDKETWELALLLMLCICDLLLRAPSVQGDFAHVCGERCLQALFRCWTIACSSTPPAPRPSNGISLHHYPSYVQWKTFHDVSKMWRHRLPLVEIWMQTLLNFHRQVLLLLVSPPLPSTSSSNMPLILSWALLHFLIGNPNDLSRPQLITKTEFLLSSAIMNNNTTTPTAETTPTSVNHPGESPPNWLLILPLCYLKAFSGLSCIIDLYINNNNNFNADMPIQDAADNNIVGEYLDIAWPGLRQLVSSTSSSSLSSRSLSSAAAIDTLAMKPKLHRLPARQQQQLQQNNNSINKINIRGLLQFYGPWLFEAVLHQHDVIVDGLDQKLLVPPVLWSPGRAEAAGCLCRMLCRHQMYETLPKKLIARAVAALASGLSSSSSSLSLPLMHEREDYLTTTNIVGNSGDLFRSHIEGIECLWPAMLDMALHCLLQPNRQLIHPELQEGSALRQACLMQLSSMLCAVHLLARRNVPVEDARRAAFFSATPAATETRNADNNKSHRGAVDTLTSSNFSLPISQAADDDDNVTNDYAGPISEQHSREVVLDDDDNMLDDTTPTVNTVNFAAELAELPFLPPPAAPSSVLTTTPLPVLPPQEPVPPLLLPSSLASDSADADNHADVEQCSINKKMCVQSGALYQQTLVLILNFLDHTNELDATNQRLLSSLVNMAFHDADENSYAPFRILLCLSHLLQQLNNNTNTSHDLTFSRSTLQVLLNAARMQQPHCAGPRESHHALVRLCVEAICQYISVQVRRPPTAHSKELHNCIILAYQCLLMWIVLQPMAIINSSSSSSTNGKNVSVLNVVAQVLELGLYGVTTNNNNNKMSVGGSPISMRVRDIAEQIQSQILQHLSALKCFFTLPSALSPVTNSGEDDIKQFFKQQSPKTFDIFLDDAVLLSLIDVKNSSTTFDNNKLANGIDGEKRRIPKQVENCWWNSAPTLAVVQNALGRSMWLFRQQRRKQSLGLVADYYAADVVAKKCKRKNSKKKRFTATVAAAKYRNNNVDNVQQQNVSPLPSPSSASGGGSDEKQDLRPVPLKPIVIDQEYRKCIDLLPGAEQIPECEADRIFSTMDELTMSAKQKTPNDDFQTLLEYVTASSLSKPSSGVWDDLPSNDTDSVGAYLRTGFKRYDDSFAKNNNSNNMPSVTVSQLVSGLGLHNSSANNNYSTSIGFVQNQATKTSSPAHNNSNAPAPPATVLNGSVRRNTTATASNRGGNSKKVATTNSKVPPGVVSSNHNNNSPKRNVGVGGAAGSSAANTNQQLSSSSGVQQLSTVLVANPAERQLLTQVQSISMRPLDWVLVFYVEDEPLSAVDDDDEQQQAFTQMLSNSVKFDAVNVSSSNAVSPGSTNPEYYLFLQALGYIVPVFDMCNSSRDTTTVTQLGISSSMSSCRYLDGIEHVLFYADHLQQLGMTVPSLRNIGGCHDGLADDKTDGSVTVNNEYNPAEQQQQQVIGEGRARSLSADDVSISVATNNNIHQQPDNNNTDLNAETLTSLLPNSSPPPPLSLSNAQENAASSVKQRSNTSVVPPAAATTNNKMNAQQQPHQASPSTLLCVIWLNNSNQSKALTMLGRHNCRRLLPEKVMQQQQQLPSSSNTMPMTAIYISPHICAGLYELNVRTLVTNGYNQVCGERSTDVLMPTIHDGQIVSHRILASIVRQAALQFYNNQRLSDHHHHHHHHQANAAAGTGVGSGLVANVNSSAASSSSYVKRKQLIHDLSHKFDIGVAGVGGGISSSKKKSISASCAVTDSFLFW